MKLGSWRRRLTAIAAGTAVLAVTACSTGGGETTPEPSDAPPYQVFYPAGFTGFLALSSAGVARGIEAAVDYLNDQGGINGRLIELTTQDTQSDATNIVTFMQEAADSDTPPDLIIPGIGSTDGLAAAPVSTRLEIPTIALGTNAALNDPEQYPYLFSAAVSTADMIGNLGKWLKERDVESIAVVVPNDGYGTGLVDAFKAPQFQASGIEFKEFLFQPDAVDYAPTFQQAIAADTDWLFMDAAGSYVATMLDSRVRAGAGDIPTVIGNTSMGQKVLEITAGTDQLENTYSILEPTVAFVPEDDRNTQLAALLEGLAAQGPLDVPLPTYAVGWDAVMLWAEAVASIDGEVTNAAVRDALENLPKDTVRVKWSIPFTSESHFSSPGPDDYVIAQVTDLTDGMYEYIED